MIAPVQPVSASRGYHTRSHPSATAGGMVNEGGGSYPAYTHQLTDQYSYTNRHDGQSIFTSHGIIFGSASKKTNSECGKIRSVVVCSVNREHKPENRHICCKEPTCPVCYPKFSHRLAHGIIERVTGYQTVYPGDPMYHLVMWGKKDALFTSMKEAFNAFSKMFLKIGGKAAAVIYHPYRIKKELLPRLREYRDKNPELQKVGFWTFAHDDVLGIGSLSEYVIPGPHFHAIATGYLQNSRLFHRKTGWGYKKKNESELTDSYLISLAHYLATHTAWEWGKHSVRYIGDMSYSKLGRTKEGVRRELVKCRVCGSLVQERAWSNEMELIGDCIQTEIEEKILLWQYWKRVKKSRVKRAGSLSAP